MYARKSMLAPNYCTFYCFPGKASFSSFLFFSFLPQIQDCKTFKHQCGSSQTGNSLLVLIYDKRREAKSLLAYSHTVLCAGPSLAMQIERTRRPPRQGRMAVMLGEPETACWSCESGSRPELRGAELLAGSGPRNAETRSDRKSCWSKVWVTDVGARGQLARLAFLPWLHSSLFCSVYTALPSFSVD